MPALSRQLWRLPAIVAAAAFLHFAASAGAAAEPRIALVIGNANYSGEFKHRGNPINDAILITESLSKAGFDVTTATDADQKEMKQAIDEFGAKLAAAGPEVTALFYYAGHGLQEPYGYYLFPAHAEIKREVDLKRNAISADIVLKQMQFADARVSILIFDTCDENPSPISFRAARIGKGQTAPRGSLVAYSMAPSDEANGDVMNDSNGINNPYTAALAQAVTTPGLSIEEAFHVARDNVRAQTGNAQIPWQSSSLAEPFYFIPKEAMQATGTNIVQVATSATSPAGVDQDAREIEFALWNSISDSNDPADFAVYLKQYPNGNFAKLARNNLNLLTGNTASVLAHHPQMSKLQGARPAPSFPLPQDLATRLRPSHAAATMTAYLF